MGQREYLEGQECVFMKFGVQSFKSLPFPVGIRPPRFLKPRRSFFSGVQPSYKIGKRSVFLHFKPGSCFGFAKFFKENAWFFQTNQASHSSVGSSRTLQDSGEPL